MRFYPKIPHISDVKFSESVDKVYVQEKVDGACGGFEWRGDENRLAFMSHHREIVPAAPGMFATGINYVERTINIDNICPEFTYYGEYGITHTIQYETLPLFIGFDVYNNSEQQYLDADSAKAEFDKIGLPFVPTIQICTRSEILDLSPYHKSKFRDGNAEGIVVKTYSPNGDQFAKAVTDEFKEANRAVFGFSKRAATNANELFIATYCTEARIMKAIYRHLDDGEELHMRLMVTLPSEVWYDICEECWKDFTSSNWVLDMRLLRKLVATRCVQTLKLFIGRKQHEILSNT